MSKTKDGRMDTITSITNPLKFFALALLMVEALIAGLSVAASSLALTLSVLATGMFVLVVLAVVWLVAKHPEALLAQKPSDLVRRQNEVEKLTEKIVQRIETMYAERKLQTADVQVTLQAAVMEGEQPVVSAPPPRRKREA